MVQSEKNGIVAPVEDDIKEKGVFVFCFLFFCFFVFLFFCFFVFLFFVVFFVYVCLLLIRA